MKLIILLLSFVVFCTGEPWSTQANSLNVQGILKDNTRPNRLEAHSKHFKGTTLAYVTPWNNRGKKKKNGQSYCLFIIYRL